MNFFSPSKGHLTLEATFKDIILYINDQADDTYNLIIGSDSHTYMNEEVTFVTAIVIHRVGKGGRYYFHKQKHRYMDSLRQRIFFETSISLEVASKISEMLANSGYADMDVEIHLDVGERGDTKNIIKEVVGMVIGSGYMAKIKPDSYGATKVADKYTR